MNTDSSTAAPSRPHLRASALRSARDTAVQAVRAAAGLIRMHAGSADVRERKGTNDFVTEVDEQAQEIVLRHLTGAFPDYDVLAEEGADLDASTPTAADAPRWIVDPIDGTTNFMHDVSPYAVSIALQDGDRLVVAVLLDVASDELYTAVRGEGAYLDGAPMTVNRSESLGDVLLSTGFPIRSFKHIDLFSEVLKEMIQRTQGVRRHGAASVDLARTAAGRFAGFFETGLSPWDVAAGALLVQEAGGRVTDYRGRSVVDGDGFLFGRQILATGGPIHDEMLDLLAPMQDVRDGAFSGA